MHPTVYLQLGSNLFNREKQLQMAREAITKRIGPLLAVSAIYQTPAWGMEDQPDFLNQVITVQTSLHPIAILEEALKIEQDMGRERKEKWGPRLIDIDIIAIDDQVINLPQLTVPHPWMHVRRFVLEPMHDIAPFWVHPILGVTVQELLAALPPP
jgi:2-amino-4-hydroxy-6-hydroxymethyldihydropteridine diphosphokinase